VVSSCLHQLLPRRPGQASSGRFVGGNLHTNDSRFVWWVGFFFHRAINRHSTAKGSVCACVSEAASACACTYLRRCM